MNDPEDEVPFDRKWFRFGLTIAVLHAVFTLVLVQLLAVDVRLALLVGVIGGTLGAVAVIVFVRYIYT